MNSLIQNSLVMLVFTISIVFLMRKFVIKKPANSKKTKSCGSSGCGCD